ncbi:DUF5057 domain-containing protein [Paenibacillus sp. BC26]|uniref:DUF5057 domain-containing protein n=1 Tax=Paenibacillus sp. BC26 TaxID=1881032 RepID=UPI0011603E33|nr:DUF5057 domain-containing protein [Paenibacillus sp. BC26]
MSTRMNARLRARMKAKTIVVRLLFLSMIAALIIIPGLYLKDAYANGTVYYAIKADTNFITVGGSGVLYANTTSIGTAAEQFELIDNGGNTYSIKSKSTGKYVTAPSESSSSIPLAATAAAIGENEKFKMDDERLLAIKANVYVKVNSTSMQLFASETKKSKGTELRFTQNVTKLLEITDGGGTSDLQPKLGSLPNISIDTISMKRFVALRGDLDGKYDGIYIGKGYFNPTKVIKTSSSNRAAAHETVSLENDITLLKAGEIVDDFITKGQPVFIYSDTTTGLLNQGYKNSSGNFVSLRGNLYNTFAPYSSAGRDNVVFLNATGLSNLASNLSNSNSIYSKLLNQRPKLVLSGQPTSYLLDSSALYRAGDTLSFHFNVPNYTNFGDGRLTANLYLGLDQAVAFGNDQIVASSVVTNNNDDSELTYVLPKGYSGLYYWKLEIVDQTTKMKSYETGVFKYRDQLTKVRVLQVMPNDSDTSSLKKSGNLDQSFLSKTNEYEISITTMKFNDFNSTGKANLNGNYDMLIFGLADSYNSNASITVDTANVVNNFIRTGQSVMFTHDTVFSSSENDRNTWINQFQQTTGQIEPWTNLGLSAPNTSTVVKKVNDGLLTQFPFILSDTPKVATTHNQYFTLDLEDETVVPWYNIIGSNRDENDSWNHYYTYSKGNVTYSGTGHTNSGFPTWEQQLFVNTMYRAYMGSNHAPMLTVYNPLDYSSATDNFIPSYQNINLSFKPEDYDFTDRNLTVSVKYSYNDGTGLKTITQPITTAVSGTTINSVITNPFTAGDGDLSIEITVTDKTGAKITKTIPVKVKKVSSNLTVKRTISGLSSGSELTLDKGTSTTLTYTATPKDITKSGSVDASTLKIQGITFAETLPPGLEIVGTLPSGITATGNVSTGYKLNGTFNTLTYTLSGSTYTAPQIQFSITVKPTITGTLPLNNSSLTFKDVGQTATTTLPFDTYSLNSIVRLTGLSIGVQDVTLVNKKDSTGATVYDTATIIPTFTPADATPKFTWTSSNTTVATIITTIAGNGYVTGVAPGVTTVRVTDSITGQTATAQVTVLESGLNIIGDSTVTAGMTMDLSGALVKPSRETVSNIEWSIFNPADGSLSTGSGWQTKLTGLKAGTIKVSLHVTTTYNSTIDGSTVTTSYDASKDITITNPVLSLTGSSNLTVGDTIPLTAALQKSLSDNTPITDSRVIQSVSWTLKEADKQKIASLPASTGKLLVNELKGLAPGTATVVVTVKLLDNTVITKELSITIEYPVLTLTTGTSSIGIGDIAQLTAKLQKSATNTTAVTDDSVTITWGLGSTSDSSLASLGTAASNQFTNQLQGLAPGNVTVVASVKLADGTVIKDTLPVTVVSPDPSLVGTRTTISIGDTISLTAALKKSVSSNTEIAASMIKDVKWGLEGSNAEELVDLPIPTGKQMNNSLKAIAPGNVTVFVKFQLMNDTWVSARRSITIEEPYLNLSGPVNISLGDTVELKATLQKSQSNSAPIADDSVIQGDLEWDRSNTKVELLSNSSGKQYTKNLHALVPGTTTVTVSLKLQNGTPYSKQVEITINKPVVTLSGPLKVGVGDVIELTAGLKKSETNSSPITDTSLINGVTWSLKEAGADQIVTLPASTGKNFTNDLSAMDNGNVTIIVSVKLLDNSVVKEELPLTIQNRALKLDGSLIVKAASAFNYPVSWEGAAGTPSFTYEPEWTLLNSPSKGTSLTGSHNSAKLTTGWQDGGTVTIQVKVKSPAGKVFTEELTVDIVLIKLPATVPHLKVNQQMNLASSQSLSIIPAKHRATIVPRLVWTSANSNIVAVSANGVIEGINYGSTTITVYDPVLQITLTVKVTVDKSDKY